MKIKTSELTRSALNYAVATALKLSIDTPIGGAVLAWEKDALTDEDETLVVFSPSTDWSQGGPIIEREKLVVEPYKTTSLWSAFNFRTGDTEMQAPTPLVAAMRCFVASKLGDEVEIPEELL